MKKTIPPTSIETWIDIFPFLGKVEWSTYFTIPQKITREPYLQSFQYKILNRIINCKEKLFKWKISETPVCIYCNEIDTIEHHFFYCRESSLFWNRLEKWLENNLQLKFSFTVCEIIFGIPLDNAQPEIVMINFIILLGKWYINKNRTDEKLLYFINFIELVKEKIEIMTNANQINSRDNKAWQETLQSIL